MAIFPATEGPPGNGPSPQQRRLAGALLAALLFIAISIVLIQAEYDPSRWRAQPEHMADSDMQAATLTAESTPVEGIEPMSPPETYDAASLSDKIDGKAELYLAAGFKSLRCQRFRLTGDPARWMERFVYDMGIYRNAFAVFSRQRRDHARPLALTADAYQSANGLFLVQGSYYIEIVGSDQSEALAGKMIALATAFVEAHPSAETRANERALFPTENLVPDSVTLTPVNAFGFDRFDRIYSAHYRLQDKTATAFLSRRASAEEARSLTAAYIDFLITYGGNRIDLPAGAPPVTAVEILGTYEIVFDSKDFLAGVHEADDLETGLTIAKRLLRKLNGEGHGP